MDYIYDGIFSIKREAHSVMCDNMDEPWGHYAKWNKPGTERQILHASCFYLDVVSKIAFPIFLDVFPFTC